MTARAPKRRRTRPAKFTPNGGEGRAAGGRSYALGKRKLLPPPSSPIAPPTMPKMLDDVPGESPLLNASLFNDGGEPSPAVVYAGRPINGLSSHDAVAANSWAAQAASIAAAAERRRGSRWVFFCCSLDVCQMNFVFFPPGSGSTRGVWEHPRGSRYFAGTPRTRSGTSLRTRCTPPEASSRSRISRGEPVSSF